MKKPPPRTKDREREREQHRERSRSHKAKLVFARLNPKVIIALRAKRAAGMSVRDFSKDTGHAVSMIHKYTKDVLVNPSHNGAKRLLFTVLKLSRTEMGRVE